MCITAALPSGHSPGFGSSEVPLQLLSQMKPPQQMSEFYKPGERHEVLQAVLNTGKVTWKLHSWLWGEAMCGHQHQPQGKDVLCHQTLLW